MQPLTVENQRSVPYVALNTPENPEVQIVPEHRDSALEFRRWAENCFCPIKVGGCGGALEIVVGNQRVPHARHRRSVTECGLTNSGSMETHTRVQRALVNWLRSNGYRAWIEVLIRNDTDRDGRADVVSDIEGIGLVDFEVQLSPDMVGNSVEERTSRYLGARSQLRNHKGRTITVVAWVHDHDPRFPSIEIDEQGSAMVLPPEEWGLSTDSYFYLENCRLGITVDDVNTGRPATIPFVSSRMRKAVEELVAADTGRALRQLEKSRELRNRLTRQLDMLDEQDRVNNEILAETTPTLALADEIRRRRTADMRRVAKGSQTGPNMES